jgi:CHAD domain-containing protein
VASLLRDKVSSSSLLTALKFLQLGLSTQIPKAKLLTLTLTEFPKALPVNSKPTIPKDSGLVHWMNEVLREADKASDSFNSEPVHDLRVALRRCRSMADGFRAMDPHKDWKKMRRQATTLFDSLGALRDCHVMMELAEAVGPKADPLTPRILEHLHEQEMVFKREARNAIESFDRQKWDQYALALPRRAGRLAIGSDVFQVLALEKLITARRLHSQALKTGAELAFHRLRIKIKKFRYVVENFLPQLHQEWRGGLKTIQDLLGEIHDLDVLRETVSSLGALAVPETTKEWDGMLHNERRVRIERYAELMSGEGSLWRVWRSALPQGDAARDASRKKLQAWSSFLDSDLQHSRRVCHFAVQIHDSLVLFGLLAGSHKNSRELLKAAATVHEVGRFVGNRDHHKSTEQMVSKLDQVVGWTRRDIMTMASVARYHRGALPQTGSLRDIPIEQRKTIMLLAGILRLANTLDDNHDGQIKNIKLSQKEGYIEIHANGLRGDSPLAERVAAARHLLEVACGRPILVQPLRMQASRKRRKS